MYFFIVLLITLTLHTYLWRRVDIFLHNVTDLCQPISRPRRGVSEAHQDLVTGQHVILQLPLPGRLKVADIAGEGVGESL